MKQFVECLAATGTIIFISPLLLALAILVKCTSRGPVFYISDRLGRHGRIFRLIKFRSMHVNVPQITAPDGKVLTLQNDSRLTPIGALLRLGFDELPQLFNVVKGEMAIIGPRPDVPWELARYNVRERRRLEVLPGITGLTQVVGGREMSNAQNYELDVRYVENAGWGTDLLILLITLPYALGAKRVGRSILKKYLYELETINR